MWGYHMEWDEWANKNVSGRYTEVENGLLYWKFRWGNLRGKESFEELGAYKMGILYSN